ncbi:MAG: guanylate kinase [Hyphomicrobiaceae bacterium]|nr:guanylate kinase [Hyphomicrobiaceae bacterium]
MILVLSSPSGAGKSSLARTLLQTDDRFELSVSVTTRAKRASEIEGTHYHFLTREEFEAARDRGDLLEWAEVHGNFYGTPRAPVEKALGEGRDILFDIDWQGTEQVRAAMPADTVTIFILPPSFTELKARLMRRAEDAPEVIEKRLRNAADEIAHWPDYHDVIVNDDLGRAYRELVGIIEAERRRRDRIAVGGTLAASLLQESGRPA